MLVNQVFKPVLNANVFIFVLKFGTNVESFTKKSVV